MTLTRDLFLEASESEALLFYFVYTLHTNFTCINMQSIFVYRTYSEQNTATHFLLSFPISSTGIQIVCASMDSLERDLRSILDNFPCEEIRRGVCLGLKTKM